MPYVYMIKNDFGKLYVGVSEDPNSRLLDHNTNLGARFTKGKAKFKIVFLEKHESLVKAREREIQIKKWRRDKKEILIDKFSSGLPTLPAEQ